MTEPLDLAETRLILRARRGESDALRMLWDRHTTLLWSIAQPLLGDRAVPALQLLQARLKASAPGLELRSMREQLLEMLFVVVTDHLQPVDLRGIGRERVPAPKVGPLASDAQNRIAQALADAPLETRLVYLFTFLGQLGSAHVARLGGWDEADVRRLRAWMAWRLVEATHAP